MGRAFEFRKARKFKRWGNMARVFTKLGKEITIAVKAGGPDPGSNPRLRVLMQTAKKENMPKDNVDRAGGTLGTTGSLEFLFDHKCVFHILKKDGVSLDDLELELIDYGVDELEEDEGEVILYGDFAQNAAIQKYLEENGYEITSSEFVRIPNDLKDVTPEQRETIDKLIERLEEDEDVQNVFHNMKESEEEE